MASPQFRRAQAVARWSSPNRTGAVHADDTAVRAELSTLRRDHQRALVAIDRQEIESTAALTSRLMETPCELPSSKRSRFACP